MFLLGCGLLQVFSGKMLRFRDRCRLCLSTCSCLLAPVVFELVDTHAVYTSAGLGAVSRAFVVARPRLLGRLGVPAEAFWTWGSGFDGGIATTVASVKTETK